MYDSRDPYRRYEMEKRKRHWLIIDTHIRRCIAIWNTKKFLIVRSNTVSIVLQISDYIFQIIFVRKKAKNEKRLRKSHIHIPTSHKLPDDTVKKKQRIKKLSFVYCMYCSSSIIEVNECTQWMLLFFIVINYKVAIGSRLTHEGELTYN